MAVALLSVQRTYIPAGPWKSRTYRNQQFCGRRTRCGLASLHNSLSCVSRQQPHCSFWRKKTLRRFLEQCGIPSAFLATWHSDETKRDFLERLFDQLPKGDGGRATILSLAKSLADQQGFPDLKGWEESERLNREASEAVRALRQYLDAQDEEIATEKDQDDACISLLSTSTGDCLVRRQTLQQAARSPR